ncbi:hypothetical protein L1987_46263 [Smallanthus sonchifolius]|uniref:Uncharacterized protein n=1 Tax=Smallanthus sonchifolius TaxID=185202 RepID=A0ACB9G085_9ASTR|nr:hypothetical protein L1987_46263 [Smallanthus sonchifolius]
MKRLPVRSLIQFRSVSKAWKSLIDSSDFIAQYSAQQQHLLVSYHDDSDKKFVSIADDDTFPQHKVYLTVPRFVEGGRIIGCSHGLLCVYGHCTTLEQSWLLTGAWRSPYRTNLPRNTIHFGDFQVVIDGFLYSLATEKITSGRYDKLIISFDITSEEFSEVNLPDCLAHHPCYQTLSMSKLRESLVVLRHDVIERDVVVWMMEMVFQNCL